MSMLPDCVVDVEPANFIQVVAWGFFVALWTGVGESRWRDRNQWRLGFAIQSIPALILGVGVLFIGESPRWLCLKGRHEEAKKAFLIYHYDGSNDDWCESEFSLIQQNIEEEIKAQGRLSWGDLLRTPMFRRRLFAGSFVWAAAMLSGESVPYGLTTRVTNMANPRHFVRPVLPSRNLCHSPV